MNHLCLQPSSLPPRLPTSERSVKAGAATLQRAGPIERQPREENRPGSFFVDHTCIDCDTCRWMAPNTFARVNQATAVVQQPEGQQGRQQALQALLACPTYSIHCADRSSAELRAAADSFPLPIEGSSHAFHCGYSSEASYGSVSYLLIREGGNVLVDSPRYDAKLFKRIQALGGAKYMFLTHRDDVADHVKWQAHLGCERIIHELEANASQQTTQCEIQLKGSGPWSLPDGGADVQLIHTPGHTRGHVVLHYLPEQILFSGDHLMFRAGGNMGFSKDYNWYSVPKQLETIGKNKELDIRLILPGHGRRGSFQDHEDMLAKFDDLLARGAE